jgi:LPXTG-motif cell wall-anchored protein
VITILWGRPTEYASFLAKEIRFRYHGPLLIVMPAGIGFAHDRHDTRSEHRALASVRIAQGDDGLAVTAIRAISVLAARAGHPITPAAITPPASTGGSNVLVVTAVVAVLLLAGLAALVLRRRRPGRGAGA